MFLTTNDLLVKERNALVHRIATLKKAKHQARNRGRYSVVHDLQKSVDACQKRIKQINEALKKGTPLKPHAVKPAFRVVPYPPHRAPPRLLRAGVGLQPVERPLQNVQSDVNLQPPGNPEIPYDDLQKASGGASSPAAASQPQDPGGYQSQPQLPMPAAEPSLWKNPFVWVGGVFVLGVGAWAMTRSNKPARATVQVRAGHTGNASQGG